MNYLIYALILIGYSVAYFKLFPKADRKGWEGLIPGYNFYVLLKIANRPWWWLVFLIFPGVNILMLMVFNYQTAVLFGKRNPVEQALAIFLPFIYLPFIAFQEDTSFYGQIDRSKEKKSFWKEWLDAIVFAIIAASIIRTYVLEAFTIPTSSMEKTLLKGDYLFVSKVNYGPRIPNTPLSFPFAHHTIPGTEALPSFLEWMDLPYVRIPGFEDIERNDIVVFNFPEGDTVASKVQNQSYYDLVRQYGRENVKSENPTTKRKAKEFFGDILVRPVDKRENYIKRCVAVPGDKLEIKAGVLYINDDPGLIPDEQQFRYIVKAKTSLNKKQMKNNFDINPDDLYYDPSIGSFIIPLSSEKRELLAKQSFIESVTPLIQPVNPKDKSRRIFPNDSSYHWNQDNFGPITIPKAGSTVNLTMENLPIYRRIIDLYENNDLEVTNGTIRINGEETDSYTFKMNYYWLMGDSRHNSQDSRFWGFVPEDHVVGKAVFIWMSIDPDKSWSDGKIRWDRLFSLIHD